MTMRDIFNRVINSIMYIVIYVAIRHAIAEAKYRYCHGSLLKTLISSGSPLCMLANKVNYEMDQYVIGLVLLFNVRHGFFNYFGSTIPGNTYQKFRSHLQLKSS